jgi:LytR cell envelope-related transcriptional attenuator
MDQTPSPAEPPKGEPSAENVGPPPLPLAPVVSPTAAPQQHSPGQMKTAARPRLGQEIGGKKFRVGTGDEYVPFRSRTKRRRKLIAAGVFGALVVGAGAYGVVTLVGSDSRSTTAACPAKANATANANPAAVIRPSAAGSGQVTAAQITLNVYNATGRQGLAASTAKQLKSRGFTIGKVANDPLKANLTVAAEVRGAVTSAMHMVAAEVIGSQLRSDTRTDGSVDLVLGAGFTALASPQQVEATLASASPSPNKKSVTCH